MNGKSAPEEAAATKAAATTGAEDNVGDSAGDDERIGILLVDDNEVFRRATGRVLRAVGYQVVGEAENGRRAVELTQALRPNLILMDIEMPEMDGITASRKIQRSRPTPVILLTAHESLDTLLEAKDAGVAAYLVKPVDAQELQRTVTIALARFQDWMALRRLNRELQKRNAQLKRAMHAVKTLQGLLSVCAWCGNKLEDEKGHWVSLEAYIEEHSEAKFTHGICPECLNKMQAGRKKR